MSRRCWPRSIASKGTVRRSRSGVCTCVFGSRRRWMTGDRKMCGCISTMRHSGARLELPQGTTSSTSDPKPDSRQPAARFDRLDELFDDLRHALGGLDELDARPVVHDLLIHVADSTVRDAALQDDGSLAECQPDVVQRVQVERE